MPKSKRIVCYAINGSGLGHLTRLRTVAKWLRRYVSLLDGQSPEVIFLTSSDASDSLADAGFAAFKIPSKTVARKTELNKLEYRRLAKHFVWNSIGVFSPDLLVVDTFPSGSFDELFQVLDGPFKSSFIYRNVNAEYATRATFRSALRMYDQVVAPHSQDESNRGGFAAHDGNLTFTGEVIQFEQADLLPRSVARKQLGIPGDKKLVYLSAGGGGDPNAESQLRWLAEQLAHLDQVHLLIGAGPLYRGPRLSGSNITWFDGPSIAKYFAGLDAAVSAAGYNTFHELLYARVPTAFFQQEKIADDQLARIQKATAANACRCVETMTDAGSVTSVVRDLLEEDNAKQTRVACEQFLPTNGASNCAIELLRPLYGDDQLSWARSVLTPRLAHGLETLSSSTSVVAQWITPLMPGNKIKSHDQSHVIAAIMHQLSPSAANEVQQVLDSNEPNDLAQIESKLIDLVERFQLWQEPDRPRVADAVLKTLLATMKKQPLSGELEANWATWICEVIDSTFGLLACDDDSVSSVTTTIDQLRLFRAFPRIVDADVSTATDLFRQFLSNHHMRGVPTHEVDQAIQLLKLTHTRVTVSLIRETLNGSNANDTNAPSQTAERNAW